MKLAVSFALCMLLSVGLFAQASIKKEKTKVMTLGVFHFDYPNLDYKKVSDKDKISVLDEPFQSEIVAIARAIEEFKPTIVVVECEPKHQRRIDSLYTEYAQGRFMLKKNEIYQLGFRIAKDRGLAKVHCVDDFGNRFASLEQMLADSVREARFWKYYEYINDSLYRDEPEEGRVSSIVDAFLKANDPDRVKRDLGGYLQGPFSYEEQPGDFMGVDFETGRWFNRNLRIYRNIQRVPHTSKDRILVIFGSGHLNLLNPFIDASREFELVSSYPYLRKAKNLKR
ncbi:DUF5694 domain-containing protein [Alistipes sp. ZOR0009]|uniref:DUF5694 domain-containing protein n=1 Tax=Alistipes sp. ZOR0009 TaxID=1339253 RepID=UPI000AEEB46C|nr:DUF5694 domain-containing protein [Alistipes sp. ZOR0009]